MPSSGLELPAILFGSFNLFQKKQFMHLQSLTVRRRKVPGTRKESSLPTILSVFFRGDVKLQGCNIFLYTDLVRDT